MRILLSGFEPFGERNRNSSLELAEALGGAPGVDVVTVPVEYARASVVVEEAVRASSEPYDLVLCFGESGEASSIKFEWSALNLQAASLADNAGALLRGESIDASIGHGFFSSWNFSKLRAALDNIDGLELSYFAGTYVCNRLFFDLLRREKELGVKTAFIHVPLFDKSGPEGLDLASGKAILEKFISHLKGDSSCLYSDSI